MKRGGRPPLEGIIADGLFSFIRNLLLHFPIFKTWDEVYVNKNLATWSKKGQIDKFLHKCTQIKIDGSGILQYRIWEVKKEKMTYFSIHFRLVYPRLLSLVPCKTSCQHLQKLCLSNKYHFDYRPQENVLKSMSFFLS